MGLRQLHLKQLSFLQREEADEWDLRVDDVDLPPPPLFFLRVIRMVTMTAMTRIAPSTITMIKGISFEVSFTILIGSPSIVVLMYSMLYNSLTISTSMLRSKGSVELRLT